MSADPRQTEQNDAQLIVRAGKTRFAISTGQVREVVRLPRVTPVPLGPAMLIGLGNVRGETLAILGPEQSRVQVTGNHRQLLVLEGQDRIGIAVDAVERLEQTDKRARGGRVRKLPVESWIAAAFPVRETARRAGFGMRQASAKARDERIALLRFSLAGQSFALPFDQIAEVAAVPAAIAVLPGADAAVVGTMLWRERTLGVLAPSVLLGVGGASPVRSREQRIVIITIGGHLVGLLVDRIEGLLRTAPDRIDPVPQALQHGTSEARIEAICRPEEGGLVSVLASDHLLNETRTRRLLISREAAVENIVRRETLAVLLLSIDEHRLALPLTTIEQVAHVPEGLTPVPGAPAWLAGVTQLGGGAIPIVDQVLRLTGTPCAGSRRRLIVVQASGERIGFMVDDARTIDHIERTALAPAPLPGSLASGIYGEALGYGKQGDTLLLLDPAAMISSADQDIIHAIAHSGCVDAA